MQALHSYYLVYWETEDTTKRPVRAIPLLGSYQVRMFPVYEKVRNMISLITNERIFFILTPSEDEMRLWYTSLSRVIARLNAAGSPEQTNIPLLEDDAGVPIDCDSIYSNMNGMASDGDTFVDEGLYERIEELDLTAEEEEEEEEEEGEGVAGVQDNKSSVDFDMKRGEIHHALRPVVQPIQRSTTDISSAGSTSGVTARDGQQRPSSVKTNRPPVEEKIYDEVENIWSVVGEGRGGGGVGGESSDNRFKVDICKDLLTLTLKSTAIMNTAGSSDTTSMSSCISGSDPSGRDGFFVSHGCYEVTLRKR